MKRRAGQLVVLLILGAIVNIAVAWGIANSIDATSTDQEVISPAGSASGWYVARHRTRVSLWIVAMINLHSAQEMVVADSRVPSWSRVKHLPGYTEGQPMPMIHDFAFGWPCLSMWYAHNVERDWQTGAVV